ncbi:MAG: putative toxin-antitoxin system toxin component, PIN family [Candidatus Altiarchaeota archaeon]|nr:putative toxin-antitoxin system toxin component, PIN family [Candidatus Altiarchaeota archaeon]
MTEYFLDTNIIVSGLLWDGNESEILRLAQQGRLQAITSQYVLDEVAHVLRDYFSFDTERVIKRMSEVAPDFTRIVDVNKKEVLTQSRKLTDKKDAPILAAVVKSRAVLVTGDRKLAEEAKRYIKVISAKELLSEVDVD